MEEVGMVMLVPLENPCKKTQLRRQPCYLLCDRDTARRRWAKTTSGTQVILLPLKRKWKFTSCAMWASMFSPSKQHKPNTMSKHFFLLLFLTHTHTQHSAGCGLNLNSWCHLPKFKQNSIFIFISSNIKLSAAAFPLFFFLLVSSSRLLCMKTVDFPDKKPFWITVGHT